MPWDNGSETEKTNEGFPSIEEDKHTAMSSEVKKNFRRRLRRLTLIFGLVILLFSLLFITLLRPAPVRSEHNLDGCGSHYLVFGSPKRPAGGLPPSHRPAEKSIADFADFIDKKGEVRPGPARWVRLGKLRQCMVWSGKVS